jgi:hypothetical protein
MKKRILSAVVAAIAAVALLSFGATSAPDSSRTQADTPAYCPKLGSIDLPCMV